MDIEFFEPSAACKTCGQCCKSLPGAHVPDDFGLDLIESVRAKLASGRYALDWWEGDVAESRELDSVLYLRPATKRLEGKVFDGSWGGECTFLTPSGCSLARPDMPAECKALRPRSSRKGDCPSTFGKQEVALAWRPYQSLLAMIADEIQRQKEAA